MSSKTRLVMYTLLVASFQPTMWRICIELASSPPRSTFSPAKPWIENKDSLKIPY